MLHTDKAFADAVEEAVSAIERTTDAEIIVVAAPRSSTYDDLRQQAAAVVVVAVAVAALAVPHELHPWWLLLELTALGLVAARAAGAAPVLARLVPEARARREVRRAAAEEFLREQVHTTPHRTGVLVYVSALEACTELIVDVGVQGRVAPAELATAARRLDAHAPDAFLAGLRDLGALLARDLPHHAGSDDADLPNAPRIRG